MSICIDSNKIRTNSPRNEINFSALRHILPSGWVELSFRRTANCLNWEIETTWFTGVSCEYKTIHWLLLINTLTFVSSAWIFFNYWQKTDKIGKIFCYSQMYTARCSSKIFIYAALKKQIIKFWIWMNSEATHYR
jgi:hypothetical protein